MPAGLYLNPPDAAVVGVRRVENRGLRALDRTAAILPLMPGVPLAQNT